MTTQFRTINGTWRIASTENFSNGQRVTVERRGGLTSEVIIRQLVAREPSHELPYLYSFDDARRAAGATPTTERETVRGFERLFEMFERAQRSVNTMANQASHSPRTVAVRFDLPNTDRGLRFEMAAPNSHRYAGCLLALTQERGTNARRRMYGYLGRDGAFVATVGATEIEREIHREVLSRLQAFAIDPAGFAGAQGRQTGNCCFCGRGLTDSRSVQVGYGPICAEYYGLPWGDGTPPDFDVSRGPERQRERLADNAGRPNNFDTLNSLAEAMQQPIGSFRIQAAEELSVGDFVYRDNDGRWRRTDRGQAQAVVSEIRTEVTDRAFVQHVSAMPYLLPSTAATPVTRTYRRERPVALSNAPITPRPLRGIRRPNWPNALTTPAGQDETTTNTIRRTPRPAPDRTDEDGFVWSQPFDINANR